MNVVDFFDLFYFFILAIGVLKEKKNARNLFIKLDEMSSMFLVKNKFLDFYKMCFFLRISKKYK